MRYGLLVSLLLLGAPLAAIAQVSIGITIGSYPQFAPVPGYPVYYAPGVNLNFFFYDGLYWVYQDDRWYSSDWYDGPWNLVDPYYVPVYVLQVPVRYYRRPPAYFRGWEADRAPRWDDHWGRAWVQRRPGWDQPLRPVAPAPLPDYQRQYRGNNYPKADQQRVLRDRNYHYRPQEGGARPASAPTISRQPAAQQRSQQQRPLEQRPPPQSPQVDQRSQPSPPTPRAAPRTDAPPQQHGKPDKPDQGAESRKQNDHQKGDNQQKDQREKDR